MKQMSRIHDSSGSSSITYDMSLYECKAIHDSTEFTVSSSKKVQQLKKMLTGSSFFSRDSIGRSENKLTADKTKKRNSSSFDFNNDTDYYSQINGSDSKRQRCSNEVYEKGSSSDIKNSIEDNSESLEDHPRSMFMGYDGAIISERSERYDED